MNLGFYSIHLFEQIFGILSEDFVRDSGITLIKHIRKVDVK